MKSCVLSKRWRYLWTSIPTFVFSNRNYDKVESFISFVDNVLTHSTCSIIKKFKLDFHHSDWKFHSVISKWLNFAVEKKRVEDVALDAAYVLMTTLLMKSLTMYTCSSLITLGLFLFASSLFDFSKELLEVSLRKWSL